jgi:L-rhamnose mutarotase
MDTGNWHGVFFAIRPGKSDEYMERHRHVPEPLKKVLKRAGIRNYTIWRHGDLLFACYQAADGRRMERILGASPDYRQWRKEMESIVYVEPVTGRKEWPMELAFFLP